MYFLNIFVNHHKDPRARLFETDKTESEITAYYDKLFSDAETIEFWVKAYTPTSKANVVMIYQENHFTFGMDGNAKQIKFSINTAVFLIA